MSQRGEATSNGRSKRQSISFFFHACLCAPLVSQSLTDHNHDAHNTTHTTQGSRVP